MRSARCTAALGAVLLLVGGLNACSDSGSGDVVARVGKSPIAKTAVDHWISVMAGGGITADGSNPQYQALRQRALSFLISSQWRLDEAAELGVRITDSEARAQLALLSYDRLEGIKYEGIPQQGEFPALFSRARNHSDRLWLMKLVILTSRVEKKRLAEAERKITHAEIARYYDEHTVRFVVPERRDVQWIVTYSESSLQKAVREIRSGKSFVGVARRVSLDPPTISGLELDSAPEKDFARHVFTAKPHVLTGPFRQVQNRYMLEVTKVTLAHRQTLAQSQASIRQRLAARWAATGMREAFERKWNSRTSCRAGYIVPSCRRRWSITSSSGSA